MRLDVKESLKKRKNEIDKEPIDIKREIFSWVESLIFSMIAVSLIITFLVRPVRVEGSSMLPTLIENEVMLTTNISRNFKHNDIVVIRRRNDTAIVKRIIALPGDTIDIDFDTGSVYLNGELLNEPFISELTMQKHDFEGPVTVPEGYVFVMGDNRNRSDDSRTNKIGLIDMRNIFGKAFMVIFPLYAVHIL